MIPQTNKKALTEISEIISCMKPELKEKIPDEINEFIEQNKDDSYDFEYNKCIEVLPETKAFLSVLLSEYIGSEKTKQKWKEYDLEYITLLEKEKSQNYTTDVFKKSETDKPVSPMLTEYKESFFQKIINKIKSFFKSSK